MERGTEPSLIRRARESAESTRDLVDGRPGEPEDSLPAGDPSLRGLSVAGFTRRRAAWILAAIIAVWIVSVFVRQVGDAGTASDRADALRAQNAAIGASVESLQKEQALVQRQAYIEQQARAYGLGGRAERPFTLSADAPSLPPDAPGSATVRLGAPSPSISPLDSWLDLLFGSGR